MSTTEAEAAKAVCPLVRGPCMGGVCHFWLWDAVRNRHTIPWPDDIPRPGRVEKLSSLREGRELGEAVRNALTPMKGRSMFGGVVIAAFGTDISMASIGVEVEKRETGDCCLRRAGERKP